jgi:hypothetical protein
MQPNGSHETALGERWLATSEVVWENVDLDRRDPRSHPAPAGPW